MISLTGAGEGVREGLTEEVALEQRPTEGEGGNQRGELGHPR